MYMGAQPIWDAWTAGGAMGRANARVLVEPDWLLIKDDVAFVRGRGTWWRDDPSTLTPFAASTSWVVDGRRRSGVRSFQRVRNGEWEWWGEGGVAGSIAAPASPITRAAIATYLKGAADAAKAANPALPALPTYDGTPDYTDIGAESTPVKTAIGQLSQAGIIKGYPDGTYKPSDITSETQKANFVSRMNSFLYGSTGAPGGSVELPNVRTVSWDRSIDTDAAECTVVIDNIMMKPNEDPQPDENELGFPGYFTPRRGENMDSTARWPNHIANEWANVLLPNCLVRTFEGYGGLDLTVKEAVEAGFLRQTGTWMVDRVTVGTDGQITLQARDMARLLLDQQGYPPIVPTAIYPARYERYCHLESGEMRSGNFFDYCDIAYDYLLWSGFWFDIYPRDEPPTIGGGPAPEPGTEGFAQVYGVIETTGVPGVEADAPDITLPDDLFDKRPIIDIITELRGIVGYLFWVDGQGGAHFQSPNFFQSGNFDENNEQIDFIPEIDERVNATSYSMELSSENLRTKIIISAEAIPPVPKYGSPAEAYKAYKDALSRSTWYTPTEGQEMWHGMELPAMWVNGAFQDLEEQQVMAELIAMHIQFRSRQGSLSMAGNPNIEINDQVRILERTTSESFIHYVRGVSSSLDNTTGRYEMTLTTHWLGTDDEFIMNAGPGGNVSPKLLTRMRTGGGYGRGGWGLRGA